MTAFYLVVYAAVTWYIYNQFKSTLVEIDVTNDEGETYKMLALVNGSYVMILIIVVWTGFAFWFIGRNSLSYLFYY